MTPLEQLQQSIIACRACPRLVAWREAIGVEKRAAFRDEDYWAKPVPGFGDPHARLLVVGLAPAAHGGNRTGRVFTGDRSGDWLYAALHRAGFANQPTSVSRDDGLQLLDCYVSACVRCAPPDNKPTPDERDRCVPFLVEEIRLLPDVRVVVCLGGFAWDGVLRVFSSSPLLPVLRAGEGSGVRGARKLQKIQGLARDLPPHPGPLPPGVLGGEGEDAAGKVVARKPKFGHGAKATIGPYHLLGCYHPSQQNTFTGRLTVPMIDAVFARAKELLVENPENGAI